MLMYGEAYCVSGDVVYNLTSLKEGYQRLYSLIPPNELGRFTGKEFDIAYMNYIINNDFVFFEFFQIIYNLYIGKDVYIIVSSDDWSENLVESLIKFIQQRYGYNATKISSFDDYIYSANSKYIAGFTPGYGLMNLDIDKERYSYILEAIKIRNGIPSSNE